MQEILSRQNIGRRIRELRIENTLSQELVAKLVGVSRSNYSQIELGNQYPSYEILAKIAVLYKKSYEWILHGENFAIKTNMLMYPGPNKSDARGFKAAIAEKTGRICLVKNVQYTEYTRSLKDFKFIAGLSLIDIPINSRDTDKEGIYRAFEVADDCMSPVLQKEDIIIARNIKKFSDLIFNDMYVLITGEDILIRRVVRSIEDHNTLVCKTDNFNSPVYITQLSDLQEIWHIRGIFSTKFTDIVNRMEHYLKKLEKSITSLKKEVAEIKKK